MSIMRRMSDVLQQKMSRILDRADDPSEALDFSYQRQLDELQRVRRSVVEVLAAEKRLELQGAQLEQNQAKLRAQAAAALSQGREDIARLALTRVQALQAQRDGLRPQIARMKDQEAKLEAAAQTLVAKVEALRVQKETIKAQYTAAEATTRIGEAVTGLSEHMADVTMVVERAQDRTAQMQARASAIDALIESGTLDQVGAGGTDDIDRMLRPGHDQAAAEAELEAMKRRLGVPQERALPSAEIVVRIQGGDQYRLPPADRAELDRFDADLVAAVEAGGESAFAAALHETLAYVRSHGERLAVPELSPSQLVLPAEDTTLAEARQILHGHRTEAASP